MKYHTVRPQKQNLYRQSINRFFGQLSPSLFRQALNLKNSITSLEMPQSGSWEEVLTAENGAPWLTAHHWLLEGRPLREGTSRERVDECLYRAMFFTYLYIWLDMAIRNPDSVFSADYSPLATALEEEARQNLGELLPAGHPFWQDYAAIAARYQAGIGWQERWRESGQTAFEGADWLHYADRLAPTKIGITAAAHLLGQAEELPGLWEMMDFANQAVQIREDVGALRRDILRGHLSYPIMRTLVLAGMGMERPFKLQQLLGAAVLTGSIKKVCGEGMERLAASRQKAAELSVAGWMGYCDEVEEGLRDIQSLFSVGRASGKSANRPAGFLPYRDVMGQCLGMAAGFLLADPAFGESVEVNRGGLEGLDEARGIIFPFSFISYLLLENGHALEGHVDQIFERMDRLGYRYYEEMAVAPDADETAILLRLFKFSGSQEQHRRQLVRPLGWLEANVLPDGRIPAFWDKVDVPVLERMVVWENYCMTAEVNTLIGLIDYDWACYQGLIERAAAGMLGRYLESDFGAVAYYGPLYTLWQMLALVRRLEGKTADPALIQLLEKAAVALYARLEREAGREGYTPQEAAFLTMACLDGGHEGLLNRAWIGYLQKTQRHDGGWDDEPFYITCDRDGLPGNWYSSRTMTAAFCYHALKGFTKDRI